MKRRRVLGATGLGFASLLAGCSGMGDGNGGDGNGGDRNGDGDPGSGTGTPDGQWRLRARVTNEDDEPRSWRVEARSGGGTVVAAWGTVSPGETVGTTLSGRLGGDPPTVYAESDAGSISAPWQPADCSRLDAVVAISDGDPQLDFECDEEGTAR